MGTRDVKIAIVNDNCKTVMHAAANGFKAYTPMQIVNYINALEDKSMMSHIPGLSSN